MLDRQYSRIIRWVHRAQTMSAGGNFSDAILDVECARAELDDARQELLLCHKLGAQRRRMPRFILVVSGALAAVVVWAAPLSLERVPAAGGGQNIASLPQSRAVTPAATSAVPQTPPLDIRAEAVVAEELPRGGLTASEVYRLTEIGRRVLQKNRSPVILEIN